MLWFSLHWLCLVRVLFLCPSNMRPSLRTVSPTDGFGVRLETSASIQKSLGKWFRWLSNQEGSRSEVLARSFIRNSQVISPWERKFDQGLKWWKKRVGMDLGVCESRIWKPSLPIDQDEHQVTARFQLVEHSSESVDLLLETGDKSCC